MSISILNCTNPPNEIYTKYLENNETIDTVNLYIDVKNSSTALFIPDVLEDILYKNSRLNNIESSIFQNILHTVSNWKAWCHYRKLNCNIYLANDKGKSSYHTKINPSYKANRSIRNSTIQNLEEEIDNIKYINWQMAKKIINKYVNNTFFIQLDFLESDFLPYYLITRKFEDYNNILHVLISSDKDHFQVLNLPNTVMYYKMRNDEFIFDRYNYMYRYLSLNKTENKGKYIQYINEVDPKLISLIMSFVGDTSDNIKGCTRVAEKSAIKIFAENKEFFYKILSDWDGFTNKILTENLSFEEYGKDVTITEKLSHLLENESDKIIKAFKQIDYEILCLWLEQENKMFKIDMLKSINDILDSEKINVSLDDLWVNGIMKMDDIYLQKSDLNYLI